MPVNGRSVIVPIGVWQRWQDIDTVAIVSTDAGPAMTGLHHREPVVLERAPVDLRQKALRLAGTAPRRV